MDVERKVGQLYSDSKKKAIKRKHKKKLSKKFKKRQRKNTNLKWESPKNTKHL